MDGFRNREIFSNNLKRYIDLSGKERGQIANDLEFSYSTFTDWINGNTYPRIDRIEKLANYFGINKSDLIEKKPVAVKRAFTTTPVLGQIAAGAPLLAEENIEEYFNIDSSVKADFILRVKGDSMIDGGIQEGDLAFFHKQNQLENGEVGAIYIDGEATLKKFYKNNGTVILQAQNSAYQPIVLSNGDVRILGKLVAVLSIKG